MVPDRFDYRRDIYGDEIKSPPQGDTSSVANSNGATAPENQTEENRPFQSRTFGRGLYASLPVLRLRRIIQAFAISDLRIIPSRAHPGETINIVFKATNSSHSTSIYTVTLKINGHITAADVISLPPRSVLPLNFAIGAESPGYYRVEVNEQTSSYVVYGKSRAVNEHIPSEVQKGPFPYIREERKIEALRTEEYGKSRQNRAGSGGGIQSSIDSAGSAIEHILDKLGDGLIFPIILLMKIIHRLRESGIDRK